MRIGELAGRAGLTTKTLRFYEQAGVLPGPPRTPSGYRDYDEAALARLRFVRAAQVAGLTLAEIRTVLALHEDQSAPCWHVTALLDRHAATLNERLIELEGIRAEVRRLRERAATRDSSICADNHTCLANRTHESVSGGTPAATPTARTAGR